MGNCISKVNKDPFLVYEGLMKNDILFSKGMTGRALEMDTRGENIWEHIRVPGEKIYGSTFFVEVFRNIDVGPVTSWGVVERRLKM